MPDWLDRIKGQIENALHGADRDTDRRLRQLATVHQVGRSITSTLETEEVLNLTMAKAIELFDAEAGSLLLLEDKEDGGEPGKLAFRAVAGPVGEPWVGRRISADKGIVGMVVQTGQGQFSNAPQDDAKWSALLDNLTISEARSIICVPLSTRDRSIGALDVINRSDGSPYGQEDLDLLSNLLL